MDRGRGESGFSLPELLIVVALMGVLLSAALPRVDQVAEAAHVDAGAAGLRSVWRAQRMYWLEHREYASMLRGLEREGLLDTGFRLLEEPFTYEITSSGSATFEASAVRTGSDIWNGTLTIDETGVLDGTVRDGVGHVLTPLD